MTREQKERIDDDGYVLHCHRCHEVLMKEVHMYSVGISTDIQRLGSPIELCRNCFIVLWKEYAEKGMPYRWDDILFERRPDDIASTKPTDDATKGGTVAEPVEESPF